MKRMGERMAIIRSLIPMSMAALAWLCRSIHECKTFRVCEVCKIVGYKVWSRLIWSVWTTSVGLVRSIMTEELSLLFKRKEQRNTTKTILKAIRTSM